MSDTARLDLRTVTAPLVLAALLLTLALLAMSAPALAATPEAPITGAIWTTDATGETVNGNIYQSKEDVYLNGGPKKQSGPMKDGDYYVRVTDPSGNTVLGTSVGAADETPFKVENGVASDLYQLWAILIKGSDGTQGYDDTPNPGGEYKVWVSASSEFDPELSKTDNFKVRKKDAAEYATLNIVKFYDVNTNGIKDDGEAVLDGWKVNVTSSDVDDDVWAPVSLTVLPGTYVVTEYMPIEPNWYPTTDMEQTIELAAGDEKTVYFGNVCVGYGGGRTLGFWSNKNGASYFGETDLAKMVALNLRRAGGGDFDPSSYTAFRTWLLNANSTNMAHMLSAQLAATRLNTYNGFVSGGALIYAPGADSANAFGFTTVKALIKEANAELGLRGLTLAGSPYRSYQETLKTALDNANNNFTFVQQSPCSYTFAEEE
jgi:hypothetical protein